MAKTKKPLSIFAICINNEAIGGIGVHPQQDIHEKCAELGYWLAETFWGKALLKVDCDLISEPTISLRIVTSG